MMLNKLTPVVAMVVGATLTIGSNAVHAQHCANLGAASQEICVVFQEFPTGAGPIVLRGSNPLVVPAGTTIGNYTVDPTGLTFTLSPTGDVQAPGFALAANGTLRQSGGGGTTLAVVAHGGLFQPPIGPWKGDLFLVGTSTTALSVIQLGGGTGYDVGLSEPQVGPFSRIVEESVWSPGAFGGTILGAPIALAPVSVVMVLAVNIPEFNGSITVPATVGVGPDGLAPAASVGDPVDVLFLAVPPAGVVERFPQSQFTISNDGTCSDGHYHTMLSSVSSLEGAELADPDPLGCGYGKVSEVGVATVDHLTASTTLTSDFPVAASKDLVIGSNAVLTLPSGLGISNQGIITIARTGALVVNGEFLNKGIVNNFGHLDVNGALLNKDNAELVNRDGGTLLDVGSVDNYGLVFNAGLVDIDGIFRNLCDAIYDDTGATDGSITPIDCLGCPGVGSCCEQQATAACQDLSCCLSVCQQDAFCCAVQWDTTCADLANSACGACSPHGACCTVDPPGCTVGPAASCGPGDTYLGDGVTCFPDWCAAPLAGCCLGGGCVTMPLAECMQAQGQVVESCQKANSCLASTCSAEPIPLGEELNVQNSSGWFQVEAGSSGALFVDFCNQSQVDRIRILSGSACGELTPDQDSAGSCSMCVPTSGCGPIVIQLESPSGPPFNFDLDCYEVGDCGSATPQASACNPITIGPGQATSQQITLWEGHPITIEVLFANSDPTATHSAMINWGDLRNGDGTVVEPTVFPFSPGRVTGTHQYHDNGTYPVEVTLSEALGADIATYSFEVEILSRDPHVVNAYGDRTVPLGTAVRLGYQPGDLHDVLARPGKISFADNGTDDPLLSTVESFSVLVDWDDGSSDQYDEPAIETTELIGGLGSPWITLGRSAPAHVYAQPGVYTVTVTVTDDDGGVQQDQVEVAVVAGDCNNDNIPDEQQLNGVCVDQFWPPDIGGAAADTDCAECSSDVSIIADNFNLTEPTTITGVRWWGAFGNAANEHTVPQNFTVNIRENAGGSPSTVAAPLVTFTGVPTGRESAGFGHYYELVLDSPVELPLGTHWFEVYNNSGAETPVTFFWWRGSVDTEHSLPGSRFAVTNPPVAYFNFGGADNFAFQLVCQGNNDVLPPGGDGAPDDCFLQDCNGNQQRDADEVLVDPALDCDANGIPDECQSACTSEVNATYSTDDCDCTGVPDFCETGFTAPDCNANAVPDTCDGDACFTIPLSNSSTVNADWSCTLGTNPNWVSRDNRYARCFRPLTEGIAQPFEMTGVRFGVRRMQPGVLPTEMFDDIRITIAVYEDDDGCPPVHESFDLIPVVTTQRRIDSAALNSSVEVALPRTLLDPTKDYVVVISVPDQRQFGSLIHVGLNSSGASGPTYIYSDVCETIEYITLQQFGAPANLRMPLSVLGCYPLANDADGDGVPNECETAPPPLLPAPGDEVAPRFVSFVVPASSAGTETVLRAELTSLHHPPSPPPGTPDYTSFEGQLRYVNSFGGSTTCVDSTTFGTNYPCAQLGCQPESRDWYSGSEGNFGLIHVTGDSVVPSSTLTVSHIAASCGAARAAATCAQASEGLLVSTSRWGDVGSGGGAAPDGAANVIDIGLVVDNVKGLATAIPERRAWMKNPANPFGNPVNVIDVGLTVDAVKGLPYPSTPAYAIAACP